MKILIIDFFRIIILYFSSCINFLLQIKKYYVANSDSEIRSIEGAQKIRMRRWHRARHCPDRRVETKLSRVPATRPVGCSRLFFLAWIQSAVNYRVFYCFEISIVDQGRLEYRMYTND